MGIQDRDWYREDYKGREKKYGNDFNKKYQNFYDSAWEEVEPSRKRDKDPSSNGDMIIPTVCTNCQNSFQVRLKQKDVRSYSYTCPNCGRVTTVTIQTEKESKTAEENKNAFPIIVTLLGTLGSIELYRYFNNAIPIIIMVIYNLWMILDCFIKRPKTSVLIKVLATFFFIVCEFIAVMQLYELFFK